ncbi:Ig domain-containing protein [Micromonospora sp. WMMD1128]|uniref:Ig domain-containing protein n=1 Tax=Micromonospora sp. WMMD1128 TaxID=3015150 RepID=UPI00248D239F|nr:Ig domain-containing protein [Micromonospora sp. WMMD1128]WBB71973.1 Ig domain-containing protein [Micromonospora sp. WMMD1128]
MHAELLRSNRSRLLMTMSAAAMVIASLGIAAPASAAVSDGHYCGWISPDSPPGKTEDPKIINFTASVQCDGTVRRVDLTVELLYHGLVPGPGQTVNGRTEVWQNTNVTLFGLGVNSPGALCDSGYYSGRATATIQFLSGTPEFITRTAESQLASLTCPPPDLPTTPPSGAVTVINPGTQSSLKPDRVALQMQATGGSGSYTWSATGLPPGLTIDSSTGRISGTLSTIGTYNVTVTADGGGQGSTTFTWSVRKESPCTRC